MAQALDMGFIHTDVLAAAERYPDRTAVWSESGALTYAELECRSRRLAERLAGYGVGRASRVGMMLPRTGDAVAAVLGILRIGAVYVPLDPAWPRARVTRILDGAGLSLLIASDHDADRDRSIPRVITPEDDQWMCACPAGNAADAELSGEDMAYTLYTSGSTGDPKGVCISHRAAHYFADWARKEFELCETDRLAAVSPFTFDLSTFDLFSGLASGAAVHLVSPRVKMLPAQLSRFLEEHRVTAVYAVPSTLSLLASRGLLEKRDLQSLRLVLFAGEAFPPAQLRRLMAQLPEGVRYANLYGPTETNVCTWYQVPPGPIADGPLPIGQSLPGTRVFTLPHAGSEQGRELCVAGPGVMSGYWGEENGNGTCWVSDPNASGRAYRTGDLVEQREDGNWLYLGRADGMVKIWGYRVELGDIESCLLQHPAVDQAVAVKVDGPGKGPELVAFIVPADRVPDSRTILSHCRQNLPRHMVPKRICAIESVPVTDTGKTDRNKLALQEESRRERHD